MHFTRRIFCLLPLALVSPRALSCSMGFSFHFDRLPEEHKYYTSDDNHSIEQFLDDRYGTGKWVYADKSLRVEVPESIGSLAVVPIQVGSVALEMAGAFRGVAIYVEDHVRVIENDKFTKEYMPREYFVGDLSKNSSKALNLKEITYMAKKTHKIAHFGLSDESFPYVTLRLNMSEGGSKFRIFAVFLPNDQNAPVKVAKQEKSAWSEHPCKKITYIRGEWPMDLKKVYNYE